jgi:hypothetical protein
MGTTPLLIPELASSQIHFEVREIRQALVCRPGAIDCVLASNNSTTSSSPSLIFQEMVRDHLWQTKCQMKEKTAQKGWLSTKRLPGSSGSTMRSRYLACLQERNIDRAIWNRGLASGAA